MLSPEHTLSCSTVQRQTDGTQQYILCHRLIENIDRTGGHSLGADPIVRKGSYDDNRNVVPEIGEALLEMDARHAAKLDIGDETRGFVQPARLEKLFRRRESFRVEVERPQESGHCLANREIIVDTHNEGPLYHRKILFFAA
jgi:hypothetical protein